MENFELYPSYKLYQNATDKYELMLNAKDNEQLMEFIQYYMSENGVETNGYSLVNNYGFTVNVDDKLIDFRHVLNVYGVDTDYIDVTGKSFKTRQELLNVVNELIYTTVKTDEIVNKINEYFNKTLR